MEGRKNTLKEKEFQREGCERERGGEKGGGRGGGEEKESNGWREAGRRKRKSRVEGKRVGENQEKGRRKAGRRKRKRRVG